MSRIRISLGIISLLLTIDWLAIDRWQVRGTVIDAETKKGISNAWIVATFSGERPLLNIPIPPHPEHRRGECMGTLTTQTDSNGRFSISHLTFNRALANKSASFVAFKEGWIPVSVDAPLRSSLISPPPAVQETLLARGPGVDLTVIAYTSEISNRLPAYEFSSSQELRETIFFASYRRCNEPRNEAHIAALSHSISIARTLDERDRTRAGCRGLKKLLEAEEPDTVFPFDCENLPFKHEPSPEVLAVEAEIKAREAVSRQ